MSRRRSTARSTPSPPTSGGATSCAFDSTDGTIAGGLMVVAGWQQISNALTTSGVKPNPVSGLGDQASSGFAGARFSALAVRKGEIGFEIAIHGPHIGALPDHGLAMAEKLARLVVSRL